jgi:phage repressor protein C with HTH and peptisase S24 domain
MLSHEAIWRALDVLAEKNSLTPSGLARKSGLDPTSFNKSKRITAAGRPRWPSTESIAKALKATETSIEAFLGMLTNGSTDTRRELSYPDNRYDFSVRQNIPVIGLAQAGVGGFFDDGGYPVGHGWDEIDFPVARHESVFALRVVGNSMEPLYRDRDIILVSPDAEVRKGDRVVVKTRNGEVMAKLLNRRTSNQIELKSLNQEHPDRILPHDEVEWIARILWASQ